MCGEQIISKTCISVSGIFRLKGTLQKKLDRQEIKKLIPKCRKQLTQTEITPD